MVKNIQAAAYNGARTVHTNLAEDYSFSLVHLLLSKVHFTDLFEEQHYLKKIYINL